MNTLKITLRISVKNPAEEKIMGRIAITGGELFARRYIGVIIPLERKLIE